MPSNRFCSDLAYIEVTFPLSEAADVIHLQMTIVSAVFNLSLKGINIHSFPIQNGNDRAIKSESTTYMDPYTWIHIHGSDNYQCTGFS